MNNRAFTLVELTAIIVVLAAIFLVSFPSLVNTAKSDEGKKYNDMVKNLCLSGESYIYANMDDFNQLSVVDSKIEIAINRLIQYGSVNNNLKNPKTNDSIQEDVLIYTVLSDHSLDCEYKDS